MGWRFRKSFKVLPGIKLNLTSRGLSATIGASPFSVNVGPRGVYGNVSIPGTGISARQRLDAPPRGGGSAAAPGIAPASLPEPFFTPIAPSGTTTEIRSSSTELLNSQTMQELRRRLKEAYDERSKLTSEVKSAEREADFARQRYASWHSGFLFKRIFKNAFAVRKETARRQTPSWRSCGSSFD